jgi:EmrB/QacA subfamily drug resistance transporter
MAQQTASQADARGGVSRTTFATFLITSLGLFMVSLDNLVVTTALPVIRESLGASLSQLEWTVNAYTLTFAVLLLTGAALGDRFGRRRVFTGGVALFTLGSVFAALAPSGEALIVARAIQGVGAAIVTPLSLTILSAAVPAERRGVALGAWGAIAGLAIALGPVVGGAIVQGLSWQWIFWLNVPIGIALVPAAAILLRESFGPDGALDVPGLGLASGGLFALVWGLIHGNESGWTSPEIVAAFVAATFLLVGFVAWEARTANPMLPLRFFRNRAFAAANGVSILLSFSLFGSVFLLAQFFQFVQGYTPLEAGLRTLPWTLMPIFVAPIAGILSDRIGGRPLLVTGMALMGAGLAWVAAFATPTVEYLLLVPGFVTAGVGMSLFFAPTANLVLSAVRPEEEGRASGANNTIREVGGVLGVAVLASVFSANGSFASPQAFVDGMVPAVWVGAAAAAIGSVIALAIPGRRALLARMRLPEVPVMSEVLAPQRVPVRIDD